MSLPHYIYIYILYTILYIYVYACILIVISFNRVITLSNGLTALLVSKSQLMKQQIGQVACL